jgi:hypothetical protein
MTSVTPDWTPATSRDASLPRDAYQWRPCQRRLRKASDRLAIAGLVQKCPPSVAEMPYSEMDNTIYSVPFDFANYG